MSNRNWRGQAFTSLCSLVSFILLLLTAIIRDHGLDNKTVYQRLKKGGIEDRDDDKIKKLADKHDSTPIKILTIILVDKI